MKDVVGNNDLNARRLYEAVGSDWLMDRADPAYTDALLNLLRYYLKSDDKVLDICCGYGRLTIPLLKAGYNVMGIDISEVLISKGLDLFQKYDIPQQLLFVANMKELPFRKEVFDFCFCVWASFNFLVTESEQVMFLQEVYRTLKKGGSTLIECPLHQDPDDNKHICVENMSYLYCPITMAELKNVGSKSPFEQCDVLVESIAGRNRTICLLRKS
jgi:ubiquinone/menaquinone biosynthesis C-methylase UbiE